MATKTQTQPKPPTRRVIAAAIKALECVTVGDITRNTSTGDASDRIEQFSQVLNSLRTMLRVVP